MKLIEFTPDEGLIGEFETDWREFSEWNSFPNNQSQ